MRNSTSENDKEQLTQTSNRSDEQLSNSVYIIPAPPPNDLKADRPHKLRMRKDDSERRALDPKPEVEPMGITNPVYVGDDSVNDVWQGRHEVPTNVSRMTEDKGTVFANPHWDYNYSREADIETDDIIRTWL